jgi:hypothetical protein
MRLGNAAFTFITLLFFYTYSRYQVLIRYWADLTSKLCVGVIGRLVLIFVLVLFMLKLGRAMLVNVTTKVPLVLWPLMHSYA